MSIVRRAGTLPTVHPTSTPTDVEPPTSDGRTSRRERNRAAVVAAMVELIDEGVLDVTMERAAERAGVSVRSVFRYFDSVDDLRRRTVEQHLAHVDARLRHLDPADHDRRTRIAALVDDRLDMFEATTGAARVARRRADFLPIVAEHLERVRHRLHDHVLAQLGPELSTLTPARAADLAATIDVLVSRDGWEALHEVHGRDRRQVRRMWIAAVDALLP